VPLQIDTLTLNAGENIARCIYGQRINNERRNFALFETTWKQDIELPEIYLIDGEVSNAQGIEGSINDAIKNTAQGSEAHHFLLDNRHQHVRKRLHINRIPLQDNDDFGQIFPHSEAMLISNLLGQAFECLAKTDAALDSMTLLWHGRPKVGLCYPHSTLKTWIP
jgi:hypothetical protein